MTAQIQKLRFLYLLEDVTAQIQKLRFLYLPYLSASVACSLIPCVNSTGMTLTSRPSCNSRGSRRKWMDGSDKLTCMYPLQKNTPHRNKVRRNEHLNRFQHLVDVMRIHELITRAQQATPTPDARPRTSRRFHEPFILRFRNLRAVFLVKVSPFLCL